MVKRFTLAVLLALVGSAQAQDSGFIANLSTPPVTCGSAATLLVSARVRNAVTVVNPSGGVTVYLGSTAAVTAANGFPLAGGAAMTFQPYNGALYCVVATGTQVVNPVESF